MAPAVDVTNTTVAVFRVAKDQQQRENVDEQAL
jgi:hypothetical protein